MRYVVTISESVTREARIEVTAPGEEAAIDKANMIFDENNVDPDNESLTKVKTVECSTLLILPTSNRPSGHEKPRVSM